MVQEYIGAPIRRKEDVRFLTGRAEYIDDLKLPEMLHAAILRSPHAYARIISIDASQALTITGVRAVYTFDDIAPMAKPIPVRVFESPGLENFLQFPLAQDKVRYVGEPVAVVVADSRYLAEDAFDAIQVTYEPLPALADMDQSLKDQVLIHEANGSNLAGQTTISTGDTDAAFRTAEYTRKEKFKTHRHTGNPLETRGLIASFDDKSGDLTVWGPTKVPYFNRELLATSINIAEEKIHFIEPDVGGRLRCTWRVLPGRLPYPLCCYEGGAAGEVDRRPVGASGGVQPLPGGLVRSGGGS